MNGSIVVDVLVADFSLALFVTGSVLLINIT